jgi:hypothetical protein
MPSDSPQKISSQPNLDSGLLKVWINFKNAITANDIATFKKLSLDSLQCCDTTYSTTKFIDKCFKYVFDNTLVSKFESNKDINLVDVEEDATTLKQFQLVKELTPDGAWTMTFDFIKTENGYRFFGCDSFGGPICCR